MWGEPAQDDTCHLSNIEIGRHNFSVEMSKFWTSIYSNFKLVSRLMYMHVPIQCKLQNWAAFASPLRNHFPVHKALFHLESRNIRGTNSFLRNAWLLMTAKSFHFQHKGHLKHYIIKPFVSNGIVIPFRNGSKAIISASKKALIWFQSILRTITCLA